jgi:nucleoside-diphosphate-sugar epimerase
MILVTGGCGFIGSAIVKRLVEQGEQVRVIDNMSRGTTRIDGVTYFQYDLRQEQCFDSVYDGVEEIIHAAYVNGTKTFYEKPYLVLEVGVKSIVNLLDACDTYGIGKFTLLSSSEVCRAKLVGPNEAIPLVIPDPFNPRYSYSTGKIISEMLCLYFPGFERLLIARPFNVYGPNMAAGHVIPDFIAQIGQWPFRILGDGRETRSFCYIDDFVDGFMLMRACGQHRDIFNIGTEEETTIRTLARTILYLANASAAEIVESGQLREGDAPRRMPDTTKIRALGYQPRVSLIEGLKRTMAWTSETRADCLSGESSF